MHGYKHVYHGCKSIKMSILVQDVSHLTTSAGVVNAGCLSITQRRESFAALLVTFRLTLLHKPAFALACSLCGRL